MRLVSQSFATGYREMFHARLKKGVGDVISLWMVRRSVSTDRDASFPLALPAIVDGCERDTAAMQIPRERLPVHEACRTEKRCARSAARRFLSRQSRASTRARR